MNTGYFVNKKGRKQFVCYDDLKEIKSNTIKRVK